MDQIFQAVVSKLKNYPNVHIVRKYSADAAKDFCDEFFDWIYIDGDHSFKGVGADLTHYWPKMKSDGIILGDDYGIVKGVKEAVNKFRNEMPVLDFVNSGGQYWFYKP